MLNTLKLLYILPDLAYVAELLPSKKPHDFTIQSFRQINGEFLNLDEEQFIADNVIKLFSKLEEGEYHLVLPDFLFTNTIVSAKESEESKIIEYLQNQLLPEIGINTNTHEVDTTILTTFKNQAKVQISAIEKTILAPLRVGADNSKIKITALSPLSWTIKSLVSLEPSITVLQIGSMLYSALHYIGVDQTNQSSAQDTEKIAETIKTLKGVETNVQTLYLLTNSLVENRLKESLGQILPLQQLGQANSGSDQLPTYVKQIIETGAKTISIADYPVPKFKLGKATPEDEELIKQPVLKNPEDDMPDNDEREITESSHLVSETIASEPKKLELKSAVPVEKIAQTTQPAAETQNEERKQETLQDELLQRNSRPLEQETFNQSPAVSQFNKEKTMIEETTPVIKNQSGTKGLIKMLLVTLSVFVAVVAVGVGVGLGLLSLSNKQQASQTEQPTVEVEAAVSPSPTATPTPEAKKVDLATLKLLVVNATTKAGYAGTIKTTIEKAGAKSVTAGNAKGTYKSEVDGLVLMPEENADLVKTLSEASGLTLEYADGYKTEDSSQTYNAVVVLIK